MAKKIAEFVSFVSGLVSGAYSFQIKMETEDNTSFYIADWNGQGDAPQYAVATSFALAQETATRYGSRVNLVLDADTPDGGQRIGVKSFFPISDTRPLEQLPVAEEKTLKLVALPYTSFMNAGCAFCPGNSPAGQMLAAPPEAFIPVCDAHRGKAVELYGGDLYQELLKAWYNLHRTRVEWGNTDRVLDLFRMTGLDFESIVENFLTKGKTYYRSPEWRESQDGSSRILWEHVIGYSFEPARIAWYDCCRQAIYGALGLRLAEPAVATMVTFVWERRVTRLYFRNSQLAKIFVEKIPAELFTPLGNQGQMDRVYPPLEARVINSEAEAQAQAEYFRL